jgi:hypothetical protein
MKISSLDIFSWRCIDRVLYESRLKHNNQSDSSAFLRVNNHSLGFNSDMSTFANAFDRANRLKNDTITDLEADDTLNWRNYVDCLRTWWIIDERHDKDLLPPISDYLFALTKEKDRFYPIITSKEQASSLLNYYGEIAKLKERDYLCMLKDYFEYISTLEFSSKGYGTSQDSQFVDYTTTEKVGTKTTTVGTGEYTAEYLHSDFYNDYYSIKEKTTTKTEDIYGDVHHTRYQKGQVDQYYWFEKVKSSEKENFEKVLNNQDMIRSLYKDYIKLGIFSGAQKKKIKEQIEKLLRFNCLVIVQAFVDRIGEYYKPDYNFLTDLIKKEEILEQRLTSEIKTCSSLKMKSIIKKKLKMVTNSLNKLKNYTIILQNSKTQMDDIQKNLLDEIDELKKLI